MSSQTTFILDWTFILSHGASDLTQWTIGNGQAQLVHFTRLHSSWKSHETPYKKIKLLQFSFCQIKSDDWQTVQKTM